MSNIVDQTRADKIAHEIIERLVGVPGHIAVNALVEAVAAYHVVLQSPDAVERVVTLFADRLMERTAELAEASKKLREIQ